MTVLQIDREAALPFISRNSIAGQDRAGVLAGKYDDAQAIQAFAAHREQAAAELVEACVLAANYLAQLDHHPAWVIFDQLQSALTKANGDA